MTNVSFSISCPASMPGKKSQEREPIPSFYHEWVAVRAGKDAYPLYSSSPRHASVCTWRADTHGWCRKHSQTHIFRKHWFSVLKSLRVIGSDFFSARLTACLRAPWSRVHFTPIFCRFGERFFIKSFNFGSLAVVVRHFESPWLDFPRHSELPLVLNRDKTHRVDEDAVKIIHRTTEYSE